MPIPDFSLSVGCAFATWSRSRGIEVVDVGWSSPIVSVSGADVSRA